MDDNVTTLDSWNSYNRIDGYADPIAPNTTDFSLQDDYDSINEYSNFTFQNTTNSTIDESIFYYYVSLFLSVYICTCVRENLSRAFF